MTKLQKLQRVVTWARFFILQDLKYGQLGDLDISLETARLLANRKELTYQLRDSLKADYEAQKANILFERELTKNKNSS